MGTIVGGVYWALVLYTATVGVLIFLVWLFFAVLAAALIGASS